MKFPHFYAAKKIALIEAPKILILLRRLLLLLHEAGEHAIIFWSNLKVMVSYFVSAKCLDFRANIHCESEQLCRKTSAVHQKTRLLTVILPEFSKS